MTALPPVASLHFTHPAFFTLLQIDPAPNFAKIIPPINSALLAKDDTTEKRAACLVAHDILQKDSEGYVLAHWGKGWVGGCLAYIASPHAPIASTPPYITLLTTMILTAAHFPAFERQNVHPVMGKLSVSLGKLLDRSLSESEPDWDVVLHILDSTKSLILHAPAPFRPLATSLKPTLFSLILALPTPTAPAPSIPWEVRESASNLLAALHVTSGKVASAAAWNTDLKHLLAAVNKALTGLTADAWEEEPRLGLGPASVPVGAGMPDLPVDPLRRVPAALEWLQGLTQAILDMLQFPTSRSVVVPVSTIVATGLRCLALSLDTPTVPYISPQHHALVATSLCQIWTAGMQLLGALALSIGDHLVPHLSTILDHTVWLLERTPTIMLETRTQLLKFHVLLLTLHPSSIIPTDYTSRLLRLGLSALSPMLDTKSKPSTGVTAGGEAGDERGGKKGKGKKRGRGAEDGLVGDLEGRARRCLSDGEVDVVVEALRLNHLLHTSPSIPPPLLTLSIRLHLSLHLTLPSLSARFPVFPPSGTQGAPDVKAGVETVLGGVLERGEGWGKGYDSVIVATLSSGSSSSSGAATAKGLKGVLHPKLPPLSRSMPALAELHFFTREGEAEKKERRSLGLGVGASAGDEEDEEDEDEEEEEKVGKKVKMTGSTDTVVYAPVGPVVPIQTLAVPSQPPSQANTSAYALPTVSTLPTIPTLVPAAPAPAPAPAPAQMIDPNFISFSSTTTTTTTQGVETTAAMGMSGDVDMEEGMPEMDSGSEDMEDDDEDDDEDDEE